MLKQIAVGVALAGCVWAEEMPPTVETWRCAEWAFDAQRDFAAGGGDAVRLDAVFTHAPSGREMRIPGFWDGGRTFRVRFAPPQAGAWTWRTECADEPSLGGRTGSFTARPYSGSLEVYRRGFVGIRPGDKHFTYADGTPFFYLGDTHWGLHAEEIDAPGPNAGDIKTDSHLGYIVRRRVEQGFTVLQSEPIGARFNVADGRVDAADIDGFRRADRYYRLIADAGLVHANAEFFFAAEMRLPLATNDVALARLSRYWVARFGAFPVMWTLGQEIDNDFYHEHGEQKAYSFANNPWVKVAEYMHACDAYAHPLSGHQENTGYTTVTGAGSSSPRRNGNGRSVFADKEVARRTGHSWWAVQWSPPLTGNAQAVLAQDYWKSERPAVNYEGRYCCLWTKDFGARAQGWISFLSGMCGYGYGAIDIWLYQSKYDIKKDSHDGVETITVADKLLPWSVSVEFESARQVGYMRRFFEKIPWWTLKPDFTGGSRFRPANGALHTCATDGDRLAVVYFHGRSTATGTLQGLRPNGAYTLAWFNPRTGESAAPIPVKADATGALALPDKADGQDWTALVQAAPASAAPQLKGDRFGNDQLAVRFEASTGWPIEVWVDGRKALEETRGDLRFDIQEDKGWASHRRDARVPQGVTQIDETTCRSRILAGPWQVDAYVRLLPKARAVRRWYVLEWRDDKPGKLRYFWTKTGQLACPDGKGGYSVPVRYPRIDVAATAFQEGRKDYSWQSPSPVLADDGRGHTVTWAIDELVDYADGGTCEVHQHAGACSVTAAFKCKGHVRKGQPQKIGDAWTVFGAGDRETALRNLPAWFRLVGQVPPPNRPAWLHHLVLYSLHPGGTIGSDCRDWGGFSAATAYLPKIREMGCNAVWLMPLEDVSIYCPRDYYKLQAGIGTPDDYKLFTKTARGLGMHVWQDCVPHGGRSEFPRAKAHPEWLAYNEDGTTLDYWCFDFNWPTWIDYMAKVVSFYTREYNLDGFRIDAVCGSHIPNWNPDIPYGRASFAQSQGGLAMQRALRKAVKDVNPDGANLAEAGDSIHGATSDAVYDFSLCYGILHNFFRTPPEMVVPRLSRWLHEQQLAEIPGQIRMRHLESHDALRAGLWYGNAAQRALMALIAWIPGIPLVYQEMEDGNFDAFREIFAIRAAYSELTTGSADYLSARAPAGVFACIRRGAKATSVPVINFNGARVKGVVTLPADVAREPVSIDLPAFGYTVLRFGDKATVPPGVAMPDRGAFAPPTARLVRIDGEAVTAPYRLEAVTNAAGVVWRVADFAGLDPAKVELVCRFDGAERWFAHTAEGSFENPYRVRHPKFNGKIGPIYRLPQGDNCLWDSRLHPFGLAAANRQVGATRGTAAWSVTPDAGTVRLLDRLGDDHALHLAVRSADGATLGVTFTRGAAAEALPSRAAATGDPRLTPLPGGWQFEEGGLRVHVQRNGALRGLWKKDAKGAWRSVLWSADIYTDVGYGYTWDRDSKSKKFEQSSDVEAYASFAREADGTLVLSFEGVLRNEQRFLKMRQPVAFRTVYRFGGDSFTLTEGVETAHLPKDGCGFLAFMASVDGLAGARFTDATGCVRTAERPSGHGRRLETRPSDAAAPVKEVVLTLRSGATLTLSNLRTTGNPPENVFFDGDNFFIDWMDCRPMPFKTNVLSTFTATVR